MKMRSAFGPRNMKINGNFKEVEAGAGRGQKASAAIGFIKATEILRKKPHITLKKLLFH
jgi:hypothetical protein